MAEIKDRCDIENCHTLKVSLISFAVWNENLTKMPFSCHILKVSPISFAVWLEQKKLTIKRPASICKLESLLSSNSNESGRLPERMR